MNSVCILALAKYHYQRNPMSHPSTSHIDLLLAEMDFNTKILKHQTDLLKKTMVRVDAISKEMALALVSYQESELVLEQAKLGDPNE